MAPHEDSNQMEEDISSCRRNLVHLVIDDDHQINVARSLLKKLIGGQGGSLVVFGPRESGRSSFIRQMSQLIQNDQHTVDESVLCVSRMGGEMLSEVLSGERIAHRPRVLFIESADELVVRARQSLLYRLLDRTKTLPWLVVLLIQRQDMLSSLEKRVRSRLSPHRVLLSRAPTRASFMHVAEEILIGEETSSDWNTFMRELLDSDTFTSGLDHLYKLDGTWSSLKRALEMFLLVLPDVPSASDAELTWTESVHATVPVSNRVVQCIQDVSRRSLGVLLCVLRRLRVDPRSRLSILRVASDYRHQCNSTEKRMLPWCDLQTFQEIEYLVSLGLLTAHGTADSRTVSAGVDVRIAIAVASQLTVGTPLQLWFESQPEN